jgi:hypothetical protein
MFMCYVWLQFYIKTRGKFSVCSAVNFSGITIGPIIITFLSSTPLSADIHILIRIKVFSRTRHAVAEGEMNCSSYSFLTSALDGVSGQRHAEAMLYPQSRTPGTHWIGDWVGFRDGLDTEARQKILCLWPVVEPLSSSLSPDTFLTSSSQTFLRNDFSSLTRDLRYHVPCWVRQFIS